MARPRKTRYICAYPKSFEFTPTFESTETVNLTFDEYEAFRLLNLDHCSQEECARQMKVARSTVAAISASAAEKIADAIVNGKNIKIYSGDVELCPHHATCCGRCSRKDCKGCGNCGKLIKKQ